MSEPVFCRESAVEYFKELVEGALVHQQVAADELTAFYVVQLLAGFLRRADDPNDLEPLALRLASALEGHGSDQRLALKQVGDISLFLSGFFADSFQRRLVDIDYYVSVGGSAYGALSRSETDAFSPVFGELAQKFMAFVDVLAEVSERSSCTTNQDLLRLYERWLKTGSRRSGQLLVERSVLPVASPRSTRPHYSRVRAPFKCVKPSHTDNFSVLASSP